MYSNISIYILSMALSKQLLGLVYLLGRMQICKTQFLFIYSLITRTRRNNLFSLTQQQANKIWIFHLQLWTSDYSQFSKSDCIEVFLGAFLDPPSQNNKSIHQRLIFFLHIARSYRHNGEVTLQKRPQSFVYCFQLVSLLIKCYRIWLQFSKHLLNYYLNFVKPSFQGLLAYLRQGGDESSGQLGP